MRLPRAVLALFVLITMVVGTPAMGHARIGSDETTAATLDDLVGPPCIEVATFDLVRPLGRVCMLELPSSAPASPPPPTAILTAAPKTSPPA